MKTITYRAIAARAGILLSAFAGSAQAMTYVAIGDSSLFQQADVVVSGTVLAAAPASGRELDATSYTLSVEQQYKGAAADSLSWQVPGAFNRNTEGALIVPGAPRFEPGESVVVFLSRSADGSFALTQLGLGAFHARSGVDGESVLEPDLEDASVLDDASGDRHRDAAGFKRWLQARAQDAETSADYWRTLKLAAVPKSKFLLPSTPVRWFQFDNGGSVTFYGGPTGQAGVAGGGYSQFQQALAAWNNDASTRINLSYAGAAAQGGGLNRSDGFNQVLFNDPLGDIAGSFDCNSGGVAATTMWRSGAPRSYLGRTYYTLTEADIVLQDGVGCLISRSGNAAELMGHELGHALGLDHPCGDAGLVACVVGSVLDQSLMRPFMHADGRGAALGSDDRAGIYALYPESSATAPSSTPSATTGNTGGAQTASGGGDSSGGGSFGEWMYGLLFLAVGRRVLRL